jgi:hypothetical protein
MARGAVAVRMAEGGSVTPEAGWNLVDHAAGEGDVFDATGRFLQADVVYAIRVYREWVDAGGGDLIERTKGARIKGTIELDRHIAGQLAPTNDVLTLQLEDGRWFDFQVMGTDGGFQANSRLRSARYGSCPGWRMRPAGAMPCGAYAPGKRSR